MVKVGRSCSDLSVDCRWNDISATSRLRGLWASMRHLVSRRAFPPDTESVSQARVQNILAWSFPYISGVSSLPSANSSCLSRGETATRQVP